MSYLGKWKIIKVLMEDPNAGPEDPAFKMFPVEEYLAAATDDEDREERMKSVNMCWLIKEDGIYSGMAIPEDTPAEEIENAKKHGIVVEDGLALMREVISYRLDGDDIYHDPTKDESFLYGDKPLKLNTEEGTLKLLTYEFARV